MTRFLIIGASSFTGSHFCEYLAQQQISYATCSLRVLNFSSAPECIINFAALNVVAPSWEHPHDYMRVNVDMTLSIFEYLRDHPYTKYVHISTPEVYGSTESNNISEDAPFNPSTPYAVSRAAAEMMLQCYAKQYGFPVAITRGCNVYGPGQQLYRLIPKLIATIKKGEKFQLEGGGQSRRAFLHVSDMVSAIYKVAMAGVGVYHISPLEGLRTIKAVAEIVCAQMCVLPDYVLVAHPQRPGQDQAYDLDSTRMRALGWKPTMDFHPGIHTVIDWVDHDWDKLFDQPMKYDFRP